MKLKFSARQYKSVTVSGLSYIIPNSLFICFLISVRLLIMGKSKQNFIRFISIHFYKKNSNLEVKTFRMYKAVPRTQDNNEKIPQVNICTSPYTHYSQFIAKCSVGEAPKRRLAHKKLFLILD